MRANRRALIRNASTDELEVLLCLYQLCLANGHVPGKDHGCSRLLAHAAGYYGLALALVSNLTRTRSLALQVWMRTVHHSRNIYSASDVRVTPV